MWANVLHRWLFIQWKKRAPCGCIQNQSWITSGGNTINVFSNLYFHMGNCMWSAGSVWKESAESAAWLTLHSNRKPKMWGCTHPVVDIRTQLRATTAQMRRCLYTFFPKVSQIVMERLPLLLDVIGSSSVSQFKGFLTLTLYHKFGKFSWNA